MGGEFQAYFAHSAPRRFFGQNRKGTNEGGDVIKKGCGGRRWREGGKEGGRASNELEKRRAEELLHFSLFAPTPPSRALKKRHRFLEGLRCRKPCPRDHFP